MLGYKTMDLAVLVRWRAELLRSWSDLGSRCFPQVLDLLVHAKNCGWWYWLRSRLVLNVAKVCFTLLDTSPNSVKVFRTADSLVLRFPFLCAFSILFYGSGAERLKFIPSSDLVVFGRNLKWLVLRPGAGERLESANSWRCAETETPSVPGDTSRKDRRDLGIRLGESTCFLGQRRIPTTTVYWNLVILKT